MPKIVPPEKRKEIRMYAIKYNQSDAARKFNVSRMYVNAIVNNRPIRNSRFTARCPITGYNL